MESVAFSSGKNPPEDVPCIKLKYAPIATDDMPASAALSRASYKPSSGTLPLCKAAALVSIHQHLQDFSKAKIWRTTENKRGAKTECASITELEGMQDLVSEDS